jgi:hypothetical protein
VGNLRDLLVQCHGGLIGLWRVTAVVAGWPDMPACAVLRKIAIAQHSLNRLAIDLQG